MAAASSKRKRSRDASSDDEYEIWEQRCSHDGYELRKAPRDLKGDRKIVMAAVSQNGLSVRLAADTMKRDREIAMAAVSQNGQGVLF